MAQAKVAGLLPRAAGTAGRHVEEGTAGAGQQSGHMAGTVTLTAFSTLHASLCMGGPRVWRARGGLHHVGTRWASADAECTAHLPGSQKALVPNPALPISSCRLRASFLCLSFLISEVG